MSWMYEELVKLLIPSGPPAIHTDVRAQISKLLPQSHLWGLMPGACSFYLKAVRDSFQ